MSGDPHEPLDVDDDVEGSTLSKGLPLGEDPPRELPHRHPQSLINASAAVYRRQMKRMLDEIVDVLTE